MKCVEHCRTHELYRAWSHAGKGRVDPHAMRNESEKCLLVIGIDKWSRSAENAGDVVEAVNDTGDPRDGVRTSSAPLCGRI